MGTVNLVSRLGQELELRTHFLIREGTYGQRGRTACRIEATQRKTTAGRLDEYYYYTDTNPAATTCENCKRTYAWREAAGAD